jgi:hypothetical protein
MTSATSNPHVPTPRLDEHECVVTGPFQLRSSTGRLIAVRQFSFERVSYCLDIRFDHEYPRGSDSLRGSALCQDPVYLTGLNDLLVRLGYEGPKVGRAEMGMQGFDHVVLEASHAFDVFAAQQGWLAYADGMDEFWFNRLLASELKGRPDPTFSTSDGAIWGLYESMLVEDWVDALLRDPANAGMTKLGLLKGHVFPALKLNAQAAVQWAQQNIDAPRLESLCHEVRPANRAPLVDGFKAADFSKPVRQR